MYRDTARFKMAVDDLKGRLDKIAGAVGVMQGLAEDLEHDLASAIRDGEFAGTAWATAGHIEGLMARLNGEYGGHLSVEVAERAAMELSDAFGAVERRADEMKQAGQADTGLDDVLADLARSEAADETA